MWTIILKRGPNYADTIKQDDTEKRAWQRADAMLDLHGLTTSKLTSNVETNTITVDASAYYWRA